MRNVPEEIPAELARVVPRGASLVADVRPIAVAVAHPSQMLCDGIAASLRVHADILVRSRTAAISDHDVARCDVLVVARSLLPVARDAGSFGVVIIDDHGAADLNAHVPTRGCAPSVVSSASGMEELVAAVRSAAAGRTFIDPQVRRARPTVASGVYADLTPRQRMVLDEMAAGKTNRQIAEALSISEQTAKTHVSAIIGRLGAASRLEAVMAVTSAPRASRAPRTNPLASAIDAAPDLFITTDRFGVVTTWNAAAAAFTGRSAADAAGRALGALIDPSRSAAWQQLIESIAAGAPAISFTAACRRATGAGCPVSWAVSSITDTGGRIAGVLVVGRDDTPQRGVSYSLCK